MIHRVATHSLRKANAFSFCWANRVPSQYAQIPFPSIVKSETPISQNKVLVTLKADTTILPSQSQIDQLKKSKLEWRYPQAESEPVTLVNFVGEAKEPTPDAPVDEAKKLEGFVAAGSKVARALHARKVSETDIHFDNDISVDQLNNFLKGLLLANYKFFMHGRDVSELTEDEKTARFTPLSKLNVVSAHSLDQVNFTERAAYYTLHARQLGNLRADIANTEFFLQEAKDIVSSNEGKVVMEYLQGDELVKHGLNLAHAVGKGSKNPPIVVNLTYFGDSSRGNEVDVAFIGKGVCFDTGGLNIKPTGYMETMHMDKCGAVATLTAFRAAVELNLKVNLTVTVGLVENSLSSTSYRPSDIIKSHKGLTVEIGNTDAEGRLVLADCMSWTQQKHKIKTMIELSTLTGACLVALGDDQAGLFSNSDTLASDLLEASKTSGESLWRLPISSNDHEAMKGTHSDLNNNDKGRKRGASKAAAFLESFVDKNVNWAHIDIAGPAEAVADKGHVTAGTTGFGVQLLLNYLMNLQKSN